MLGFAWGSFCVRRGQEESAEGSGGPREVLGGSWRGPWKPSFSLCSEVKLSAVQRHIDVFSLGSFCEVVGCFSIMVLFVVFRSFYFATQ